MSINKKKPTSEISKYLEEKKHTSSHPEKNFRVSFEHLDTTQKFASTFRDWQNDRLLSFALDTLYGYCKSPLLKQVDGDKFTLYGDFPSDDVTMFKYPETAPEDANWARIHVNGKSVLIGHVVGNTFYLVFLDKTHKFWMTKKDREKFLGKKSLKG